MLINHRERVRAVLALRLCAEVADAKSATAALPEPARLVADSFADDVAAFAGALARGDDALPELSTASLVAEQMPPAEVARAVLVATARLVSLVGSLSPVLWEWRDDASMLSLHDSISTICVRHFNAINWPVSQCLQISKPPEILARAQADVCAWVASVSADST